jgi:hypothetical protein
MSSPLRIELERAWYYVMNHKKGQRLLGGGRVRIDEIAKRRI